MERVSHSGFFQKAGRFGLAGVLMLESGCASLNSKSNPFHQIFRSNKQLNEAPVAEAIGIINYTQEDEANNFRVVDGRAYSKTDEFTPKPVEIISEKIDGNEIHRISNINATYTQLSSDGRILLRYPSRTPAPELKESIQPLLPGIEITTSGNTLMMTGCAEDFKFDDLVSIINHYDSPDPQVRVNLRIVEYFNDNTYDRELSLKALKDSIEVFNLNLPSNPDITRPLTTGISMDPFSFRNQEPYTDIYGRTINREWVFDSAIKFLNSYGKTKTLADLDVLVSNGKPVIFTNQSEIPYPEQSLIGSTILETLRYKPTGVAIKMTPFANEEGFITLDIEQAESGEQTGYAARPQWPVFRVAKLESEFIVKEGLTYLGVTSLFTRYRSVDRGIPGLGSVPVIKHMTGSKSIESNQSQLLYFITARVLPRDSLVGIQKE